MASRKEEKERLRRERLAREQAEAAAAARKRRLIFAGGGLAAIAVIAIVAIAVAAGGGGGSKSSGDSPNSTQLTAGLNTGPAPWPPEYTHLGDRFEASGLPQSASETYHIHAMLRIYINGKQEPVPANIGIDPQGQFLAALHTHDTSGIIHMEADDFYPFKLGQFMEMWGVKFTDTQIGAYYNQGKNTVQVYVNGKKVADPVNYQLKRHDAIAIGYGPAGSFPTKYNAKFPAGL